MNPSYSNELVYSASDYFVIPSIREAFGQTLIEAMACGKPVIGFPCGGMRDLLNEETGVVCSDFTVDALEEGIVKALGTTYNRDIIHRYTVDNFSI